VASPDEGRPLRAMMEQVTDFYSGLFSAAVRDGMAALDIPKGPKS
jgi:hypothetical protein